MHMKRKLREGVRSLGSRLKSYMGAAILVSLLSLLAVILHFKER